MTYLCISYQILNIIKYNFVLRVANSNVTRINWLALLLSCVLCCFLYVQVPLISYFRKKSTSPGPSPAEVDFVDMTPSCVWFNRLRIARKAMVELRRIFRRFSRALGNQGTTKGKGISGRLCWWKFCSDFTNFMDDIELRVRAVNNCSHPKNI